MRQRCWQKLIIKGKVSSIRAMKFVSQALLYSGTRRFYMFLFFADVLQ